MTDYTDLIARLREVADSGTHGPWVAVYHDTYSEVVRQEGGFTSIADVQEYSDAIVIADSRQLVPEAAAAIAALTAERDALREALFVYGDRSKMAPILRASLDAYGKENPTRREDQIRAALTAPTTGG